VQIGRELSDNASHAVEAESVEEGAEPSWFWEALGGKGEYAQGSPTEDAAAAPRLYVTRPNLVASDWKDEAGFLKGTCVQKSW